MDWSHCESSGSTSGSQRIHTDREKYGSTEKKLPASNSTSGVVSSNHCTVAREFTNQAQTHLRKREDDANRTTTQRQSLSLYVTLRVVFILVKVSH